MRVSDSPAADPAGQVQTASPAASNENASGAATAPQDEVNVSSVAQAASKALEVPESKIQELREQYLDGTYKVDAKELSSKILDEHLSE